MKKIYSAAFTRNLLSVLFILAISGLNVLQAQNPPYFKGGSTSSNTIPMNSTASRCQLIYAPNEFNTTPPAGQFITKVYMRNSAANATGTYTNFKIGFLQVNETVFTSTTFQNGATVALSSPSITITTGDQGTWFEIPLTTPFPYDNTKSLIIEITYDSRTGGISTYANSAGTGINKRLSSIVSATATTGNLQTTWNDFGFELSSSSVCTSPPTPGFALIAPLASCVGTTVNFGLTGQSGGTGQTYQWESATSISGPYNPVSGVLTSPVFNTPSLAGTTYYRAAVTCSGNTSYSDTIVVNGFNGIGGTYTINSALATGGTNFKNFQDAVAALSCGISSPVTFNVQPGSGPYNEQVIIPQVAGASASRTITFNGNGATLNFHSENTNERAVVKLNGADHVTFDNFVINTSTGTYGFGFHLINDADSNIIRNCIINNNLTTTSTNFAGIAISSSATSATTAGANSNCDGNIVENNTVNGAYYGITLVGSTTAGAQIKKNRIIGNRINNFYLYGIYISGTTESVIEGNDIQRPNRTASAADGYGIYSTSVSTGMSISKNKIHHFFEAQQSTVNDFTGIYLTSSDGTALLPNIISNNIIYNIKSQGEINGMGNVGSDYAYYYHNTISLDDVTSATTEPTRGFSNITTSALNLIYKNNIVSITRGGSGFQWAIYKGVTASTITSDYNDYYVAPGVNHYLGNVGGTATGAINYLDLTEWRTGTSQDQNSLSIWPAYLGIFSGNLFPTEATLDNKGTPVGITTDILNAARSATTPDMGAYEISACINPPTPGTVVSTANAICIGETFILSFTGGTVGTGQSIKWQSSPNNSTWTDIPGATNATYTGTQTQATWYRYVVTCGTSANSDGIQITMKPLVSGTYTINKNGGGDFLSFNEAYQFITCNVNGGINGPVVFNVAPGSGPYNERLIVQPVPGASNVNTVTFNGNGNTITWLSDVSEERATIKLDGADHFRFENLVVVAQGNLSSEYGYGFHLLNSADSNIIRNCNIQVNTNQTSTNFGGIVLSNSLTSPIGTGASECDGNIISDNTVDGGYAGITVVSNTTVFSSFNKILRNNVKNNYIYGIYINGTFETTVDSNTVSRPTRTAIAATSYGIAFSSLSTKSVVSRNTITNPFGALPSTTNTFNGIYFTGVDALSTGNRQNIVSNNLIYNITGSGDVNGIQNLGSDNTLYYHNTISIDGPASASTATTAARGFYQTTAAAGIEFRNNIISITRGGPGVKHAMYYNTPTSTIVSNRNDFYLGSTDGSSFVGFANTNDLPVLANWQTATGSDANSVSTDPQFIDPSTGNFKPLNAAINDLGTPVAGINIDILGLPRNATTPDIGAFEFSPPACVEPPTPGDATVSSTPACENSLVQLDLVNNTTGFGQTFRWQASTLLAGPYTDITGERNTSSFTVTATQTLYYRAAVTCGGTTLFSTPVLLTVTPGLPGGIYTIDQTQPSSPTNFQSFNEAKAAMACGITGPVVFNVEPGTGPYNEQVEFDSIPGASRDNTVTFNGNGNVLKFGSTVSAQRAVVKLNGTDHFRFDSLVIEAIGDSTYAWGIQLINNADSNIVRNCIITTNAVSTSSTNYHGIVISNSHTSATTTGTTRCDYNLFENNTIVGGYYGVTFTGASATPINNNSFVRNRVRDYYFAGIYVNGNNSVLIDRNDFSRPTRATAPTEVYGIYFTSVTTRARVNANRIHNLSGGNAASTTDQTAIYFTSVDAIGGQENVVSNNLVFNMVGNGDIYGIENTGSNYVRYYHNTISLDNTSSTTTVTTRGFYQTTEAEGIELKNNLITITRGGTGTRHGLYFNTANSVITSDYNNIVVAGSGGTNIFGRANAADRATLADWQNNTIYDDNSLSVDPLYVNPVGGNYTPNNLALDNKGTPVGITTDLNSQARSATVPDIGAIEFAVTFCTEPPNPGTSVASPTVNLCLGTTIQLDLTANSTGGGQTYQWQVGPTATGPWTNISAELLVPGFNYTVNSLTNKFYRAAVKCGATTEFSVPVEISFNTGILAAGDYTIDPSNPPSPTNFQSFTAAAAALQCGITGSVRFHVVPGTYTEQVRIGVVPGTSPTSTITFMSQNGIPSSVNMTYALSKADSNYVLKLDSTDYTTFKNITFTATGTTYGRAVEIAGTASNDSIINNVIVVPTSTSTGTNVVGVFGTALEGSHNVIRGNTVSNGSSGIYLSGTTLVSNSLVVDSNIISGSYYYGIYTANHNFSSVSKNKVTRSGLLNATNYSIYLTNCDSGYVVNNNEVNIANVGSTVYGIYLTGCQSRLNLMGSVSNNRVTATGTNTGNQYGMYLTSVTCSNNRNNVVSIGTSGVTSYGIYSTGTGGVNYHNNSVHSSSTSTTNNIAAYFSQSSNANGAVNIRNNIFSHSGGGRAMYVVNKNFIYSDYNLFYTNGATLIQWGTANLYSTLKQWRDTSYWDFNSLVYQPAFTSASNLQPDVASPDVWAIHGRGVQIAGNSTDVNGAARPTTLQAGVPDLGAFEFVPTSIPVALVATPATPVANSVQTFMLGTDTVAKITWGASIPSTVIGRRYSGAVPPGLAPATQYMYFYTDFDFTGTAPTGHSIKQFYIDPWQGFIPTEQQIKLGRTDATNTWQVSAASTVATLENIISESSLPNLDKYTGLTDGAAPPPPPITVLPSDSSNRGKHFWVGYGHHQDFGSGNAQEMVLYLGAGSTPANVTVAINGTAWVRNYHVPANTVIPSDFLPKAGLFDARLLQEGLSDRGISITSDEPITAYAHIYGNTNSGATMLMPVGTYGYEYYGITSKQNYAANTYSWVNVIAAYDSTVVEITPSKPTVGGRLAGQTFTVNLKKGEVYQILGAIISGSDGYDLTGTIIKSVANINGKCFPVAVFSGSSRTNIGCVNTNPTNNGDNIIQQNFPYRAWGRKYLTAPTSQQNTPSAFNTNIFKVAVKDPTTVVRRNGVIMTGLIDNLYYQFESNVADYIEADKPIMVAQFMPSANSCSWVGFGDPEMIYISPVEQGIKSVALYRNTEYNITTQYLTLIIPSNGVNSLLIDGSNTFDHTYDHPNRPGYKVVIKRWAATNGQTFVSSDSAFTAITYGLGSAESYGYNAGTLVQNLNVFPSITNIYNTSGVPNSYTCVGTPFTVSILSTVQPTRIEWAFSQVPGLSPNADVVQNNPASSGTFVINGVTYYQYTLTQNFTMSGTGSFNVPVFITHPDVEGCNNRMQSSIPINVIGAPVADFNNSIQACVNGPVLFNGTATTANNAPIATWNWNFNDPNSTPGNPNTASGQNTSHTFTTTGVYNVKLDIIGVEGCIGDVTKPVTVTVGPVVNFVPDSIGACPGDNVTFTVQNPSTNATYNWYDAPTGGNLVHTGTSYTINNVTAAVSYYVESVAAGCQSLARKRVQVTVRPSLVIPVVVVDSVGTNMIRFRWNAVPGATGYEVSINNGASWSVPSSGATGLTHTVSNLAINQTVTLQVRALGGCQLVTSTGVGATTITDQIYIPNAFTPNNDGLNDVLRVYSNVIREMRFVVFNQWGEKIFESRSQSVAWDGTFKGKPQPSGVYMYVCDITLINGTTVQRKGAINLVR